MPRTLTLKDSLEYGIGEWTFRRDEPQVVTDERIFSRLLDHDHFAEEPPVATYWLRSPGRLYTCVIDHALLRIGDDPVRVTRRQFRMLAGPIATGQLTRVKVVELLPHATRPRILVTRDMGAGDVLIATDLVHNLKLWCPDAEIHFATHERHRCLLEGNPEIVAHHAMGEVDALEYDLDIYLPRRSEVAPDCWSQVRTDMYFAEAGLPAVEHRTRFCFTPGEMNDRLDWLRDGQGWQWGDPTPIIALQPKGSGFHRSLEPRVARDIARRAVAAGYHVAIFGDSTDHWHYPAEPGIINLCGKLRDLRDVAALIQTADLLIGPDSGGYHLAAALSCPTPSLVPFTTIHPYLRVRDYPHAYPLWGPAAGTPTLPCQPCWDTLPCAGTFPCVREVNPDVVWDCAAKILAGTAERNVPNLPLAVLPC
jgi:ADP-heptose:LPS heptosyltransferase